MGSGAIPRTYNDLYLEVRRQLMSAGIEAAALEAREIVAGAAGKSKDEFFRNARQYAGTELEERVAEMVGRRVEHEPVAYLIGNWEFMGLRIRVNNDVIIPRTDTEILATAAIHAARSLGQSPRILDLCCGSGCIGIAVAVNVGDCRVVMADKSPAALAVAKRNVREHELGHHVNCVEADALQPPARAMGEFDVIVSNPPYIPTKDLGTLDRSVREYEPLIALDGGDDGLDFLKIICTKWGTSLRPGGWMLLEVGLGQHMEVIAMLERAGYESVRSIRDTGGVERVVIGRKR